MTRTQRSSPIPRFLKVDGEAGPLELLGLTPGECTPARIEAALQRQLDRVGSHAEGDTPEADEVRLALHTAAAQLLDPEVRRQVIEAQVHVPAAEALPRGENELQTHKPVPAAPEVIRTPEPIVRPSVGVRVSAQDDPNAPVRKFLIAGGVFVALAVTVLVVGIIFLSPSGPTKTTASGGGASGASTPGAGTVAEAGANPSTSSTTTSPSGTGVTWTDSTKPKPAPTPIASNRTEFIDGALVVRELRAASVKAKTDASEGVVAFRKAIAPLADWWPRFDVGQRRAADDAVLEFLYVVSDKPDAAGAAIAELAKRAVLPHERTGPLDADAIWPAAWATGMLTRLSVERELPRSLAAGVAGAINDVLGAGRAAGTLTFEGGVEAALRRMPLRLVAVGKPDGADANTPRTSVEAAKRWADAVAAANSDGLERDRLLADAMEQILVSGPEPDSDAAAYEAVEVLATRIKWRANSPARERLLEWFNDPRVSSGDLRVLTSVLTSKSNAEGVDATMLLSVTATPDDRAQLRAKYAQVWGMTKTEAREKAFADWRMYAVGGYVLNAGDDDLGKVARLVVAVKINHAARRLWLGDSAGCARIVADLDRIPNTIRDIGTPTGPTGPMIPLPGPGGPPLGPMPGPGRGPGRGPSGRQPAPAGQIATFGTDGPWAEQYLRAERNIPVRLQRLLEAENLTPPLTRLDASVLVEQGCFASPAQVRAAAQRVVMKFGDDPAIVQACLDELPLAPKIQSVSDMLARVSRATLPKIGDPEWEITARRGLVDRLLGLLAGQGPQAGIDQAAALIAESYINMAGAESGPQDESGADRCVRGAGQLFKLWRLDADRLPPPEKAPLSLDQIDRRRRSRQQIAGGPVQAFAGEEVSVAEMLSYIVCAERPVQAARAQVIIDDMAVERRAATHIFEQMMATERAITRLWMLRFGEVGQ